MLLFVLGGEATRQAWLIVTSQGYAILQPEKTLQKVTKNSKKPLG
jgi:hypothetical protein